MSAGTIFIVEDEGLIALHLTEVLSKFEFNVHEPFATGEDLLAHLAISSQPDIILMDIGLAGNLDGIETGRRIREQYNIPIIFLTAYSDQNHINEAEKITSLKYLIKPVRQEDLLTAIRKVLSDRGDAGRTPPT